MARARNIKPAFFKNELLGELSCETRLLFIGLWTLADREGRLDDRPRRIKAEIFAYDSFDVDAMLDQLQENKFLVRYKVGIAKYIQLVNFVKHQDPHYREKASEIPPMPGQSNEVVATNVTRTQRARILERDNAECQHCGSGEHPCIDHIIPVSKGGDSSDENLQVLCLSCNTKKGNKLDSTSTQGRIDVESTDAPDAPLIPDSLIPDSFNLIPDSLIKPAPARKKLTQVEDVNFAEAYALYPRRPGSSKASALKAWQARIASGVDPEVMIAGVKRYAAFVMQSRTEPKFIKMPATFFGPDRHFESDWTLAVRASGPPGYQTAAEKQKSWADRITGKTRNDQPANIIDINAGPARKLD